MVLLPPFHVHFFNQLPTPLSKFQAELLHSSIVTCSVKTLEEVCYPANRSHIHADYH